MRSSRQSDGVVALDLDMVDRVAAKHYGVLMHFQRTDIWELYETHDVVVTTNIGWDPVTYENNMGAGTVLHAANLYEALPTWYGHECKRMARTDSVDVLYRGDLGLYFFPVKPLLDPLDPERSWDQLGNYELIERMLERLAQMEHPRPVAMTLPGCGNGGLNRDRVLKLVLKHLGETELTLCDLALPEQLPAP